MRAQIKWTWVGVAILLLAYAFSTLVTGATQPSTAPLQFFIGNFRTAYLAIVLSAAILAYIWRISRD